MNGGVLCVLFCYSALTISYGQRQELDSLYLWFDSTIGEENSGLFNAREHVEVYQSITDGHRFFESSNFSLGSVRHQGQPYFGVLLKYDLYLDQLLVSIKGKIGVPPLLLDKAKIDGFSLHGHSFINLKTYVNSDADDGFYEILLETAYFTLLKKYKKKGIRRLDRKRLYYEFKPADEFAVLKDGTLSTVQSQGSVQLLFPKLKKSIRDQYRNSAKSTDLDNFMRSVFTTIVFEMEKQHNPLSE